MRNRVQILIAGGTFDKVYNPLNGELHFTKTQVPQVLNECNFLYLEPDIQEIMLIDSLYMTEQDRLKIAEGCLSSSADHIVITHGTDTMIQTGKVVRNILADQRKKTIVLTGAMYPYSLRVSDASANLSAALMLSQVLPAGVYIAMSGTVFPIENCRKDLTQGCFNPLDEDQWKTWLLQLRLSSFQLSDPQFPVIELY